MKGTLRGWLTVLAASCVLTAVLLSAPARAWSHERRRGPQNGATQPFAYIQAADAAHGRAYREPRRGHRQHRSAAPFAYIRAADDRAHPERRERRRRQHERRP